MASFPTSLELLRREELVKELDVRLDSRHSNHGAGVVQVVRDAQAAADYLRQAIAAAGGRVAGPGGAAALAGMNASTFRSKMKRLGLPGVRRGRARG
jgi:transcriptional regulator with GAF, ATPase, and Fis domain